MLQQKLLLCFSHCYSLKSTDEQNYEMDCLVYFSVTYLAGNRLCVASHEDILAVKIFYNQD